MVLGAEAFVQLSVWAEREIEPINLGGATPVFQLKHMLNEMHC